ncbi:MAG: DnaB-like helicase C-terminal domain-containing protein [Deltaproteobacteria bacterium]|nr:DnaB-like helicase C-terminal domain-containing protein [Deltaproteobacteria bacterium]
MTSEIDSLLSRSGLLEPSTLSDLLPKVHRVIEAASKEPVQGRGVTFGIAGLDEHIGGLRPGSVIGIAGRPGLGATALASWISMKAAATPSVSVLHFSRSITREQLATRMLAATARVDLARIRSGFVRGDDWPRLAQAEKQLSQAKIRIDDGPLLLARIIDTCRVHATARSNIFVIDDATALRDPDRGGGRAEQVDRACLALRSLADDLGAALVLVGRVGRAVEGRPDKRPLITDVRPRSTLPRVADALVLLHRDEVYDPRSADRGIIELNVAQNRYGSSGTVRVRFLHEYVAFDAPTG